MYYKPEDYDAIIACRSKFKYNSKASSKVSSEPKADCKLILSKNMKATLLIVGVFTKEQEDEIMKET